MPDQPTGTTPSTTKWTAQEVIDIYDNLGLPVCDDAAAIEQKVVAQRARYLRDKNSPDRAVSHRAGLWFRNVEALQNRRPELLRVVYEHFAGLSDTALTAAIASGTTTLTPELKDNLRNQLARKTCHAADNLADQWVENYKLERGIRDFEPLIQVAAIENLAAVGRLGQILLSWSLPAQNCDEIEIVRSTTSSTASETIYRGYGETSFVDGKVSAGAHYVYQAHAIFRQIPGTDSVVQGVCLGEVRQAWAGWHDQRLSLNWELPGRDVSVLIFRSSLGAPKVQAGSPEPVPLEDTELVYRGSGTTWTDPTVAEGVTYYYRIIADFGQNQFSDGVVVRAAVPHPPPPVSNLTVTYRRSLDEDLVSLEWQPAPSDIPAEYVVARRVGNAPPGNIEDGEIVETTTQTRCFDKRIMAGQRYAYAVFTRAGELLSRTGATAPAVDIVAEVLELKARVGDGTIELEWRTPANVVDVLIRRSLNPPRDHTDGALVKLTGEGHAKDQGLRNGQRYHYLVCCIYRPDGISEVISPGVCLAAVPERLPEPAENFAVQARGTEVLCTWTPPAYGQTIVVRCARAIEWPFGFRLTADEVSALGERIVAAEGGQAIDTRPDINFPYYYIFTIAGPHAVIGGSGTIAVVPDVTYLRLARLTDGLALHWVWPSGCTAVRITWRSDTWPLGPDDPQATQRTCTHVEYLAAGGKFVEKIAHGPSSFYFVVYAQMTGASGQFLAPGSAPGCRGLIQWSNWMTLSYQLASPGKGPHKGLDIQISWNITDSLPAFAGWVVIAQQTGVPQSASDGIELYRWVPGLDQSEGEHQAWINLEPIRRRRWSRFYCKLIPLDPTQEHAVLIIHPNLCRPISAAGELEIRQPNGATRRYHAGVPQTVICPYCFTEFPLEQIRFDSYEGGEIVTASYSSLDRLLHKPLQPPRNKYGQVLARKLCAKDDNHVLPYTAGTQESLVIGVIGAKFSGKSHYIAALIERLEGQVGADLQAALLPVTEETPERYRRDFYNPLFGKGLELPLTVGTPPPLIYDLTLDGKLWNEKRNRAVTLALYDTAGENLQDPVTARQMVQYLRVASGLIFLIDPLQVPSIRETLPPDVQPPALDQDAAPQQIIANVLHLLENGKVIGANEPLSIPVAVVLTKCDVLRDAGLISTNRLWSTDKRHIGYYDIAAHDDMDGMMGEYVQRWAPAAYANTTLRFSRNAFFGVSATGCASDKQTRRYQFIAPWRVEDPLLWLLAELGVIPVR